MKLIILYGILLLFDIVYGRHLPSFIHRCKHSYDGKILGDCTIKVFTETKDKFMAGVPEMQIPQLDPMSANKIVVDIGSGTAFGFHAVYTNVTVEGAKHVRVEQMDIDTMNCTAHIVAFFPKVRILSNYDIDGRILVLPMRGQGKSDSNMTDVRTYDDYKGKFVFKHGKKYVDWIENKLDVTIGGATMYYHDLFKNNPNLTESTNKVLNENALLIIEELKPLFIQTLSAINFGLMKKVFSLYSLDDLYEM